MLIEWLNLFHYFSFIYQDFKIFHFHHVIFSGLKRKKELIDKIWMQENSNFLTFSWSFFDGSAPESWCPLLSFFLSLSLSLLRSLWWCLCFLCSLSFSLSLSLCFLCFLSLSLESLFDFPATVGVPLSVWRENK